MTVKQPATRIVCFGDSLVEGEGDTACKGGWVGRLAAVLKPNHGNYGGHRIFNLGIGGATIRDLQMRFGEAAIRRPDILIIGCCSNDILVREASKTASGIAERRISVYDAQRSWPEVLTDAKRLCAKVLVVVTPRTKSLAGNAALPYGLAEHKKFIAEMCQQHGVDALMEYPSFVDATDVSTEFDHPNAKGYDLMFTDIHNKLKQLKWID